MERDNGGGGENYCKKSVSTGHKVIKSIDYRPLLSSKSAS